MRRNSPNRWTGPLPGPERIGMIELMLAAAGYVLVFPIAAFGDRITAFARAGRCVPQSQGKTDLTI